MAQSAGRERALELKVGLLIAIAAALFIGFVVALGNYSLRGGEHYYVDVDYVGSLQPGAAVKIAGIKVGKVASIDFWGGRLDPAIGRRVQVRTTVWVEERARESIRQNAEFFINTAGVLGEQYLEIAPGGWEKPPLTVGAVVRGVDPPRTDLVVARLYEFLDQVTTLLRDDREAIRNVLESGARLVDTLDSVLRENRVEVGKLLSDLDKLAVESDGLAASLRRGVGNGDAIAESLSNLQAVSATVRADLGPLLVHANRALEGVARATELVGPGDRQKVAETLDELVKIARQVDSISTDAAALASDLRHGKGTAGALLVQPEIYDNLRELTRDLKRNPWKFFWKE